MSNDKPSTAPQTQPVLRMVSPDDLPQLTGIVSRIHGLTRSEDHLRWKYFDNPAGHAVSSVADVDGRVVGHLGAVTARYRIDGEVIRGCQEVDIFVDEDFRSARTFFRLYRERLNISERENVNFSYGFTIEKTSTIGRKAMRLTQVGPIPRLMKPLDTRDWFRRRIPIGPLAAAAGTATNAMLALSGSKAPPLPDGLQITTITRFDDRFDRLWERIRDDYPVMLIKDANYLNWRYVDIPDVEYEILAAEQGDGGDIAGFCVTGLNPRDSRRGRLVDLVTPRNDSAPLTAGLIAAAVSRLRERKVATVAAWAFPHMHTHEVLRQQGFRWQPVEGQDMVCRHTGPSKPEDILPHISPQEHWCVAQGDSDSY
ncbi:MAG: GNAT family N-acetyltransferase [Maioricimonas sp. JB045]|uniref:GNAT family N-acetyltransferase n=1 Tax=Maioricimonas sp. JC845 TaxID=3232138 RepID=UPI00345B0483